MSYLTYCLLTQIQVSQEARKVVWYSHIFKNFPQFVVIHTVKGFSVVNEAEVDVFLKFPCFLDNPANVCNLISSSSSFSKPSLDIWKFLVHIMLKPSLQDFEYDLTRMGNECDCPVINSFFGKLFLGIGMRIDLFQFCGHCWVFQICWHNEYKTLMASSSSTL